MLVEAVCRDLEKQSNMSQQTAQLVEKREKLGQLASASKNLSVSEGLIKGRTHPLKGFSTDWAVCENLVSILTGNVSCED